MQLRKNTLFTNESDRNRDRRRRGNRKYGQAKYKHARKGILSCMVAALVALIMIVLIVAAFVLKGQAAAIIGSFGVFTVILSVIGLINGLRGFREREKNYITCKIGAGINGTVLFLLIAIFIRGLM